MHRSLTIAAICLIVLVAIVTVRTCSPEAPAAEAPSPHRPPTWSSDDAPPARASSDDGTAASERRAGGSVENSRPAPVPADTAVTLTLKGRIVDELGRAVEDDDCRVDVFRRTPDGFGSFAVATGTRYLREGGGRFQCVLTLTDPVPDTFEFVVTRLGSEPAATRRGSYVVNDPYVVEIDVGDLRIDVPPTLFEGRVVDESGNGIVATVTYEDPRPRHDDFRRFEFHRAIHTEADGHFSFPGWSTASYLTLRASNGMHDDGIVTGVAPGTTGLRVALNASTRGTLEVRLSVDDAAMLRKLELVVSGPGPLPPMTSNLDSEVRRFELVPPGSYRVRVRLRPLELDLVDLSDLVVPPRGACADARIQPIDLRGRLRWVKGTAQRKGGAVGHYAPVPFRGVGVASGSFLTDERGGWSLLVPVDGPAIDLLHADGSHEALRDGAVMRVD